MADFPKVKFRLIDEIMNQAGNIKASIVESELGEAAPYYRAIRSLRGLDPVQARMDYIEIN